MLNKLSKIPDCPVKTINGVTACIDDFVYLISGYAPKMNEKYNISTQK